MTDIVSILSTVFAGASAVAAALAIMIQARFQNSKDILDQSILSLQRAYGALTQNGECVSSVPADRLNWLSCARHIQNFKLLKKRIRHKLHQQLCDEHEEYWRHQFYLCLNRVPMTAPGYYAEDGTAGRAGIDVPSALIVHSFALWPKDKADLIDAVDLGELVQEANTLGPNIGLRLYVGRYAQYRHLVDRD